MCSEFPIDKVDWNRIVAPYLREFQQLMETELAQAKIEAYQKGMDEAPVYVLESKIKEIKEKTLAGVREVIERLGKKYKGDGLIVNREDSFELFADELLSELK